MVENSWRRIGYPFATAALVLGWILASGPVVGAQTPENPEASETVLIPVDFTGGGKPQSLQADYVKFDGERFTLRAPNNIEARPTASEVQLLEIDLAPVNAKIAELKKHYEEYQDLLRDVTDDSLATKYNEVWARATQLGEELEAERKKVQEANVALQEQKDAETATVKELTDKLAAKDFALEESRKQNEVLSGRLTAAADPKQALKIEDRKWSASPNVEGITVVTGTVANAGPHDFGTVVLDVSARDAQGGLLGVASTFLPNVQAGRSGLVFQADIACDASRVKEVVVTPVPLKTGE
ncbi:hypothetical protein JW916_11325 [Candidatus Sumerlaeota bacterium]|nr:hypothetical protein [Candidatus Sumerlaeota bacterium]